MRKGFTLIELLVVIFIIALLAAIIFPVGARVKDNAYRNSDSANMNALRTAINLYRVDQGGYPPQLMGYATLYYSGPSMGNVVPAEKALNFLLPSRVPNVETFRPTNDHQSDTAFTTAVWPHQDSRPAQTAPFLDLNGDGVVDNSAYPTGCSGAACYYDDDTRARQFYGPGTTVQRSLSFSDYNQATTVYNQNPLVGGETAPTTGSSVTLPAYFYNISGYDVATIKVSGGGSRNELRYARCWTDFCLNLGGNAHDDPRQLIYNDPPESTVVTWDSYFRDYTGDSVPTHDKRDIVLFLNGTAAPKDSYDVADRSWRITP